jgi:hypothetical protein
MESKRDLAIKQVPITTKHLSLNYGINFKPFKAKRTQFSPSPNYYQTTVAKLLHKFLVTRSNFDC